MYLRLITPLFIISLSPIIVSAEDSIPDRLIKAKEACNLTPLNPKCSKLLDAKYRRHKDSEKELKEDKIERYKEQHLKKSELAELRSFCRQNHDSSRCDALKSNKKN